MDFTHLFAARQFQLASLNSWPNASLCVGCCSFRAEICGEEPQGGGSVSGGTVTKKSKNKKAKKDKTGQKKKKKSKKV